MRKYWVAFAAALIAAPAAAQTPAAGEQVVDRVVAVVGDTVLLLSDVQTEMQQMRAAGGNIPDDPAAQEQIFRQILEQRVNDLVLLEAALAAGMSVRDEEVNQMVEEDVQSVRQRFGSDAAFQAAIADAGLTERAFRQTREETYRNRLLTERFVQRQLSQAARPPVSDEAIRAAFAAQTDQLGARPATISFRQSIIEPQPTDSARKAALDTAEDLLRQLREGADFAALAKRHSDDPGSREHGGDLGWFRTGRMVPAFERVAFALPAGAISNIVKTEFGYHIIRVEKARGPERQARHILIRPEITEADIARARATADSLATAARAGARLPAPARSGPTGDPAELNRIPVENLPPSYVAPLGDAAAGDVVGPFEIEGQSVPRFAVAHVTEVQQPGPYTLDEVRERIRERLQEREMVEQLVRDLRKTVYVHVQI